MLNTKFATVVTVAALLSQSDTSISTGQDAKTAPIAVHLAQQTTKYAQVHDLQHASSRHASQQQPMPCQMALPGYQRTRAYTHVKYVLRILLGRDT